MPLAFFVCKEAKTKTNESSKYSFQVWYVVSKCMHVVIGGSWMSGSVSVIPPGSALYVLYTVSSSSVCLMYNEVESIHFIRLTVKLYIV